MSKRTRLYLLSLAAVLIVGLAVGTWYLPRALRNPAHRLPDGSLLTLKAVTYGSTHRLIESEPWQRLLAPLLPPRLQPQPNRWTRVYTSDHPKTLVLWTHQERMTPASHWDWEIWENRVITSDEHGCRSETGLRTTAGAGLNWPPTEVYGAWALPAFPRRGRTLNVRIEERSAGGAWDHVATFTVSNPSPGPHPAWTPEPLPSTRQAGDLTVTLADLRTGLRHRAAGDAAEEEGWSRATFRSAWNGRLTGDWQPSAVSIADATGNAWTPRARSTRLEGDQQHYYFRSLLWPDEAAWKLRVKLERVAGFTPGELWTTPAVALPAKRRVHRVDAARARAAETIHLLGIAGPAAAVRDGYGWDANLPIAHARLSPPSGNRRLMLVRAADQRGREIPVVRSGYGGAGKYGFTLKPGEEAEQARLTFAVTRLRSIEFLARPSETPSTQSR